MNMIEAAALDAIRDYYRDHGDAHVGVAARKPDACHACRKARTFAGLIGVDLDKEDEA